MEWEVRPGWVLGRVVQDLECQSGAVGLSHLSHHRSLVY